MASPEIRGLGEVPEVLSEREGGLSSAEFMASVDLAVLVGKEVPIYVDGAWEEGKLLEVGEGKAKVLVPSKDRVVEMGADEFKGHLYADYEKNEKQRFEDRAKRAKEEKEAFHGAVIDLLDEGIQRDIERREKAS